tara:strand:+ start:3771 stop:3947 length:177 start_codon:yes stop_codon:yes gene_type:complete
VAAKMNELIFIELIVGAGIVNFLWQIQRELGKINSNLQNLHHIVEDHEDRLRKIEGEL